MCIASLVSQLLYILLFGIYTWKWKQSSINKQVLTHVVPKQVLEDDEKEMDLNNLYVCSHHQFSSAYFGHMHLDLLLFLHINQD